MTLECAGALCQGLSVSQTVQTVILWKDRLDDFTAQEAVCLLTAIPTLRTINLGQNMISADCKEYLSNLVTCNFPYLQLRMF